MDFKQDRLLDIRQIKFE